MKNVIKTQKTRKLRDSVVKKLFDFKSEKKSPWFQIAMDLFTISFIANGINLFDLLTLKKKNWKGNTISYQRRKFRNKKSAPIIKIWVSKGLAERIMKYANKDITEDGYIFPFINPDLEGENLLVEVFAFIKKMNKYLRKVAKMLRIKRISYYDARYTCLRIMRDITCFHRKDINSTEYLKMYEAPMKELSGN